MKRAFIPIFFGLMSFQAIAETSRVGNGGDEVLIEMKKITQEVIDICRCAHPVKSCRLLNESYLLRDLNNVVFETTDRDLYYQLDKVTAINLPSLSLIVSNRQRWKATNHPNKLALMYHELLGLIGAVEDLYDESPQFLFYVVNTYLQLSAVERAEMKCSLSSKFVLMKEVGLCDPTKVCFDAIFVGGQSFHLRQGQTFIFKAEKNEKTLFPFPVLYDIDLRYIGRDAYDREAFERVVKD